MGLIDEHVGAGHRRRQGLFIEDLADPGLRDRAQPSCGPLPKAERWPFARRRQPRRSRGRRRCSGRIVLEFDINRIETACRPVFLT